MDTEKLLALLNEPTEVNDKEGATNLAVYSGEIEFGLYRSNLVWWSWDAKG